MYVNINLYIYIYVCMYIYVYIHRKINMYIRPTSFNIILLIALGFQIPTFTICKKQGHLNNLWIPP